MTRNLLCLRLAFLLGVGVLLVLVARRQILEKSQKPQRLMWQAAREHSQVRGSISNGAPSVLFPKLSPDVPRAGASQLVVDERVDMAPSWTVPYGQEFWRREPGDSVARQRESRTPSSEPVANLNLGDIIERVSHAIRKDETSARPRVQADGYSAEFDGHGMRFIPHLPGGHFDPETEFSLRTLSIRHGDRLLYSPEDEPSGAVDREWNPFRVDRRTSDDTDVLPWSLLGNTAQVLLNPEAGLVEHYESGREGVEMTWVIERLPADQESLVIECEYSGLLYAGETEQGYHFQDAAGVSRVRVGKVKVVERTGRELTAAGKGWAMATRVEGNRLRIEVDSMILAQASYPLAIDPIISPEFDIDVPVIPVPAQANQSSPALAFNGTDYLVVWNDERFPTVLNGSISTTGDLFGTRVNTSGVVLDPIGIIICAVFGVQSGPAVSTDGRDFLVTWNDQRGGQEAVFGGRVSGNGEVLDPEGFLIASGGSGSKIASNGRGYLVTWSNGDIYATRLSASGAVLDATPIPICRATNLQGNVSVAANGTDYLVVWEDRRGNNSEGDIYGTLVTEAGWVMNPDGRIISQAINAQWTPAVASDGDGFLVVWQDLRNSIFDSSIYGARVSAAGAVLDVGGRIVSTRIGNEYSPAVAYNGNFYFIAWTYVQLTGTNIIGRRMTTTGTLLDLDGIPIATNASVPKSFPAVAAAGDDFLVAWTLERGNATSRSDIEGVRVVGGKLVDANRVIISTSANHQDPPGLAANGGQFLVVWADYRNNFAPRFADIYGVRVSSAGAVLDPAGLAICTAANNQLAPKVAGDGTNYLVVWQDFRNSSTNSDIYCARVGGDGQVLDAEGVPVCRAPVSQMAVAVACNGKDYFVAWEDGRPPYRINNPRIFGARITTSGMVLNPDGFQIGNGSSSEVTPAVAANNADFLVVWNDARNVSTNNTDIYGARVTGDGTLLDPNGLDICVAREAQASPAIAANGNRFLVVWSDYRDDRSPSNPTNINIRGTIVTGDGFALDRSGLAISTAPANQRSAALAAFGNDFFVVWSDERQAPAEGGYGDVFGARVAANGILVDTGGLAINTNRFLQRSPAIAYGGAGRFLIASQGTRDRTLHAVGNLLVVNFPPVAEAQSVTLNEDGSARITLSGSDANDDSLLFEVVTPPAHGVLSGSAPEMVYTPSADFVGADNFTFRAGDGQADSEPATVDIVIHAVNDPPAFVPGGDVIINEDSGTQTMPAWATSISAGPPDEVDQALHFTISLGNSILFSTPPALAPSGTLTFAPASNLHGDATVTVRLWDNGGTDNGGVDSSSERSFHITVRPVNDAPVVQSQMISVDEDGTASILLTASDVDGDELTFTIVAPPAHGTLTGAPPNLTYAPAADYSGLDSFVFKASDGQEDSNLGTVSVAVRAINDAPSAIAQAFPLFRLTPDETNLLVLSPNNSNAVVVFDASLSSDVEGDPLQFFWFEEGAPVPFASGVRVTNTLEVGSHSIVLQASDGAATGSATVHFEIITAAEAVERLNLLLNEIDLERKNKRPLIASLKAAAAAFDRGQFHNGSNQLHALQNKLRAQIAPHDPEAAERIGRAVEEIVNRLEMR